MKLHAAEPNDPFCLYGIAQEHARAGRHEEALGWYDRTIAADATNCYAYFHKARSLEDLDRTDDACSVLRAGITAAQQANDGHALSEMRGYLDQLS
jgi:tetratricopeptide (TPR) repeat protein